MNITLGSGKKVHSSTGNLNTPDCLGFGHKGSERYRSTSREVTCARCIKKANKAQATPQDENTTPAVPTSEDLTYGNASAPCRECRQPARYTIDGIHWCERHRGLADTGTNTPPHIPGDPEPTTEQSDYAHQVGDTATIAGIPGTGTITGIRTMTTGVQYGQVTYPGDSSAFAPLDDITIIDTATMSATWTITRRTGDTITDSGTVAHEHPKNAAKWYITGEGVYLDDERTDENGHLRWTIRDTYTGHDVGSLTAVKN